MSWHWERSLTAPSPPPPGAAANMRFMTPWIPPRSALLSAAVATPLPPRAFTMESSAMRTSCGGTTMSAPDCGLRAMKAPAARARASCEDAASLSASERPWRGGSLRPVKMLARPTTAAREGSASGTLMISMRRRDELASVDATSPAHPASSAEGRMDDEPET